MVRERKKGPSGPNKAPTDFKKRTAKVGKRAMAPATSTSTKFQAKRIAMPGQTVLRERDDDEVTASHGRDLNTLLGQASHYNSGVRAEAMRGLCELATKRGHMQVASRRLVATHLRALVVAACSRLGDRDDAPRAAGVDLMRHITHALLLRNTPPTSATSSSSSPSSPLPVSSSSCVLAPFEPLLVAHIGSALTSLERAVRLDALLCVAGMLQDSVHSSGLNLAVVGCGEGGGGGGGGGAQKGGRGRQQQQQGLGVGDTDTAAANTRDEDAGPVLALADKSGWLAALLPSLVAVLKSTGSGLRGRGGASSGGGGGGGGSHEVAVGGGKIMVQASAKQVQLATKDKKSKAGGGGGADSASATTTFNRLHRDGGARLNALRAVVALLGATTPDHHHHGDNHDDGGNKDMLAAASFPVTVATPFRFGNRQRSVGLSGGVGVVKSDTRDVGLKERESTDEDDTGLWVGVACALQAVWMEACPSAADSSSLGGSTSVATSGAAVASGGGRGMAASSSSSSFMVGAHSLAECVCVASAFKLVLTHLGQSRLTAVLATAKKAKATASSSSNRNSNGHHHGGNTPQEKQQQQLGHLREALVSLCSMMTNQQKHGNFFPFAQNQLLSQGASSSASVNSTTTAGASASGSLFGSVAGHSAGVLAATLDFAVVDAVVTFASFAAAADTAAPTSLYAVTYSSTKATATGSTPVRRGGELEKGGGEEAVEEEKEENDDDEEDLSGGGGSSSSLSLARSLDVVVSYLATSLLSKQQHGNVNHASSFSKSTQRLLAPLSTLLLLAASNPAATASSNNNNNDGGDGDGDGDGLVLRLFSGVQPTSAQRKRLKQRLKKKTRMLATTVPTKTKKRKFSSSSSSSPSSPSSSLLTQTPFEDQSLCVATVDLSALRAAFDNVFARTVKAILKAQKQQQQQRGGTVNSSVVVVSSSAPLPLPVGAVLVGQCALRLVRSELDASAALFSHRRNRSLLTGPPKRFAPPPATTFVSVLQVPVPPVASAAVCLKWCAHLPVLACAFARQLLFLGGATSSSTSSGCGAALVQVLKVLTVAVDRCRATIAEAGEEGVTTTADHHQGGGDLVILQDDDFRDNDAAGKGDGNITELGLKKGKGKEKNGDGGQESQVMLETKALLVTVASSMAPFFATHWPNMATVAAAAAAANHNPLQGSGAAAAAAEAEAGAEASAAAASWCHAGWCAGLSLLSSLSDADAMQATEKDLFNLTSQPPSSSPPPAAATAAASSSPSDCVARAVAAALPQLPPTYMYDPSAATLQVSGSHRRYHRSGGGGGYLRYALEVLFRNFRSASPAPSSGYLKLLMATAHACVSEVELAVAADEDGQEEEEEQGAKDGEKSVLWRLVGRLDAQLFEVARAVRLFGCSASSSSVTEDKMKAGASKKSVLDVLAPLLTVWLVQEGDEDEDDDEDDGLSSSLLWLRPRAALILLAAAIGTNPAALPAAAAAVGPPGEVALPPPPSVLILNSRRLHEAATGAVVALSSTVLRGHQHDAKRDLLLAPALALLLKVSPPAPLPLPLPPPPCDYSARGFTLSFLGAATQRLRSAGGAEANHGGGSSGLPRLSSPAAVACLLKTAQHLARRFSSSSSPPSSASASHFAESFANGAGGKSGVVAVLEEAWRELAEAATAAAVAVEGKDANFKAHGLGSLSRDLQRDTQMFCGVPPP